MNLEVGDVGVFSSERSGQVLSGRGTQRKHRARRGVNQGQDSCYSRGGNSKGDEGRGVSELENSVESLPSKHKETGSRRGPAGTQP